MARALDEDELVGHWTLLNEEMELLSGRRGPTKLAFALMLKFHQLHGRFPRGRGELPDLHRVSGVRCRGRREGGRVAGWQRVPVRATADRVRAALLAHLKDERIEPPAKQRLQRIVGSALDQSEKTLTRRVSSRIGDDVVERMFTLITRRGDDGAETEDREPQADADDGGDGEEVSAGSEGADVFAAIRQEPGNVSVTTMEKEVFKLGAIKAIGLPEDVFDDIAPGVLLSWRARVAVSSPSHLRRHGHELRVTLLAAFCTAVAGRSSTR